MRSVLSVFVVALLVAARPVAPEGGELAGAWLLVEKAPDPVEDVVEPGQEELGFCPLPVSYCPGTVSSTGMAAVLDWTGSVSISDANLVLATAPLPAGELATLFYGLGREAMPFGDGTLCVDPFGLGYVVRLRVATVPGFDPQLTYFVDFDDPNIPPEAKILPGSTWNFQTWFRDPAGGGSGVNFSNALEITFCP